MATVPINVVSDRQAVQYTGTNSAEIAALIDDFTVVSETPTTLTFASAGMQRSVPVNGWVTYWEGAVREEPFANDDDFRDVYRDADEVSEHVHDLILTTGPARMPDGNGGNGNGA